MANNNLGIRFSEDNYASKNDVARELRTNLIDSIWKDIIKYRTQYQYNLTVTDVSKNFYYITKTSNIVRKNNELTTKFARLLAKTSAWSEDSIEKYRVTLKMRKEELSAVAKHLRIIINDVAISNIINKEPVDREYAPISNYYDALMYFESHSLDEINEDTLASYYAILNGGYELLSFYRENEYNFGTQRAIINKEYNGVPVSMIESKMNELLTFINESSESTPIKIATVLYMMDYIKPFEKYNELMAILIIKLMLAKSEVDAVASIIPLEQLLFDENMRLISMMKETQKYKDVTYVNNLVTDLVSKEVQLVLDAIQVSEVDEAREAYYDKEAIEEEIKEEVVTPKVEEVKPIKVEPKVEIIKEKPVEVTPPKRKEAKELVVDTANAPKINYINIVKPTDEKSLNILEEDLLESDPLLRPAQAHFYVRHCTMGKFYTIQQFKKAEGCVYETARTSMDNLAKRGYYKREQVKNKFVYTPIKRD